MRHEEGDRTQVIKSKPYKNALAPHAIYDTRTWPNIGRRRKQIWHLTTDFKETKYLSNMS